MSRWYGVNIWRNILIENIELIIISGKNTFCFKIEAPYTYTNVCLVMRLKLLHIKVYAKKLLAHLVQHVVHASIIKQ